MNSMGSETACDFNEFNAMPIEGVPNDGGISFRICTDAADWSPMLMENVH